jgi:hypothetical protein
MKSSLISALKAALCFSSVAAASANEIRGTWIDVAGNSGDFSLQRQGAGGAGGSGAQ